MTKDNKIELTIQSYRGEDGFWHFTCAVVGLPKINKGKDMMKVTKAINFASGTGYDYFHENGTKATSLDYIEYLEYRNAKLSKKLKKAKSKLADMDVTISNEINPDMISDAIQVRLADYMNDIGKLKDDAERFRALMARSRVTSSYVSTGHEIVAKVDISCEFERTVIPKVGDGLSIDDIVSLIDSVREYGDKFPHQD